MHSDFNQALIIHKTRAVAMLSIRHLLYVCSLLKIDFSMTFKKLFVYHSITLMLLATPFCVNIFKLCTCYGMHEVSNYTNLIISALFNHSHTQHLHKFCFKVENCVQTYSVF